MDQDIGKNQVDSAFAEGSEVQVHVDVPPKSPKAGFMCIFKWTTESRQNDWKADHYNWRGNSTKKYECAAGDAKKLQFKIRIAHGESGDSFSNAFTRVAFVDAAQCRAFIVYKGDDSVAVDLYHGNAKKKNKTTKPFTKTAESTTIKIKELTLAGVKPGKICRDLIDSAPTVPDLHKVFAPRDMKQVYNASLHTREQMLITHDQFYNLHCIATHQDNFVQTIVSFPYLRVLAASEWMIDIFRGIIFRDDLCDDAMREKK